ncbi:MAG: GNAT family N-acetyltransferase [Clostridia bacterium]|nr:GNAT family N-acetyltransferase [Clostridia bacterium]MBR5278977.1 GNAT family N-acetyltransferase [Clostridia bacterium]
MADMLVKLYNLPDSKPVYTQMEEMGIKIMRPMTPNKTKIVEWVRNNFGDGWADELSTAFTRFPISCFIAYNEAEKEIIGFAGYDCTYKNFFGPTGVSESARGKGVGKALLYRCMEAMRDEGYGYAIIGGVGPAEFYKKALNATIIEGSEIGIYKDLI